MYDRPIPYSFSIRPLVNNGLLLNFHKVFYNKAFFKNPYEILADWSDLKELRDSQLIHALNKMWFTERLVIRILDYFVHYRCSFSIMGSLYPKCADEERENFRHKDYLQLGV